MPTPSYKELKKRVLSLTRENMLLKEDPIYKVLTRTALILELHKLKTRDLFILAISIQTPKAKGVKRLLNIPNPNVILRGVWEPGLFVFIVDVEPYNLVESLRVTVRNQGLNGACAYTSASGDLENDIRTCQALLQAQQEGYQT